MCAENKLKTDLFTNDDHIYRLIFQAESSNTNPVIVTFSNSMALCGQKTYDTFSDFFGVECETQFMFAVTENEVKNSLSVLYTLFHFSLFLTVP